MVKDSVLLSCLPHSFIFTWKSHFIISSGSHILLHLFIFIWKSHLFSQSTTDRFDFLIENIGEETVIKRKILDENFGRVYVPCGVRIFTYFLSVLPPN